MEPEPRKIRPVTNIPVIGDNLVVMTVIIGGEPKILRFALLPNGIDITPSMFREEIRQD